MNKSKLLFIFISLLIIPLAGINLYASDQESGESTSALQYNFNADMVSRYIWRGLGQSLNPNIQPYASLEYKNFALGAWASYGLSAPFAEIDLYLSYTLGSITITVNDYYNEDESDMSLHDYFQYNDKDSISTVHSFEGAISFGGMDNFPVSATFATFFYGDDKDEEGINYYSTYLELAYGFDIGENELSLFGGGTLAEGYYADKAAIINLGLKASREIYINERFTIPTSMSFIINPYAKDVFFVFGFTF
jgi:hypothetical protein